MQGGGAIGALPNNATVEVYGSRFERNEAASGGALQVYAELTIADSVFRDNHAIGTPDASGSGGAINVSGAANLSLCEVTLENNTAAYLGGGLFRVSTTGAAIDHLERVHIVGNTGPGVGGAYFDSVDLTLRQVDVADNTGNTAGGLWLFDSQLDAENVSIVGNTASTGLGGGVRLEGSSGKLGFSTVADNKATCPACWGAGIFGGDTLSVTAVVFADNTAATAPTTCNAASTAAGPNFQWPDDPDPCVTNVTFVDPQLAPEASLAGVDGTFRVRAPRSAGPLSGVSSGCPAIDIIGRPRTTPCTAGALEPE
jgi:hypothetical protein